MLSNKEKQEMKTLASSEAVREEFRRLRTHSLKHHSADLDHYIQFLTAMSRLNSTPAPPRPSIQYTQVKL